MKAILALLLSLTLLLSPAAMAAEPDNPVVSVDNVTAAPGQSVEVPIRLSGNSGLTGALLTVAYSQGLTLKSIIQGDALSSLTMTNPGDLSANPVNILWDGMEADFSNGVIAILRFIAPDQPGQYKITLSCQDKNIVDNQLRPVPVVLVHGSVTVEGPQSQEGPVIAADSVTVLPGQSVDVPIHISGNTGLVGARLTVSYSQGLTLTAVTKGSAFSSLTMTGPGNLSANPFNILWDGLEADDSNGIIATLRFTAPSQPGDYEIKLSYGIGDMIDNSLAPVDVTLMSGKVVVEKQLSNYVDISISDSTPSSSTLVLTNHGTELLSAWCMTALYDAQGTLSGIHFSPIQLSAEETHQVSIEIGSDIYQLKVFLLAPDTLIPYQHASSLVLNQQ